MPDSPSILLVKGDDIYLAISLEMAGQPFNLGGAASVTALVTDMNGKSLAPPIEVSPLTMGSNWALGLIVLDLPRQITSAFTNVILFEVQVVIGGRRTTWRTEQVFVEGRTSNN